MPGHPAGLEMDFRRAAVIAAQKRQQHCTEGPPGFQVEPSHDAEIHRPDGAVFHDEQVAGVDVGMKKTVPEDLFESRPGRFFQHRLGVVSGGDDGVALVQRDAEQPGRGQHPAFGAPPVHFGDPELLVAGEVVADLGRRRGLQTQIHFHFHRFGKGIDAFRQLEAPEVGFGGVDQPGNPAHQFEIALESVLDPRPQHLDGDLLALGGDGKVNLGDGRRRHRLVVEAGKKGVHGLPQFLFDGGPGLMGGKRRQTVLKLRKVLRHFLAQEIGPGGERLAQLDKARARLVQGPGQPLPRAPGGAFGVTRAGQPPGQGDHHGGDLQMFEGKQRIVAGQRPRHLEKPPDIAERAQQATISAKPNEAPRCRPKGCGP